MAGAFADMMPMISKMLSTHEIERPPKFVSRRSFFTLILYHKILKKSSLVIIVSL